MTTVRKVLIFVVACVSLNSIIVEGSYLGCDPIKDQQSLNWDDFLGFWYVTYLPAYFPGVLNHATIKITKDGSTIYKNETASILRGTSLLQHIDHSMKIGGDILECCKSGPESDGKPQVHLTRSLAIPKEGSTAKENFEFPINLLGSEITFLSKDTKCYAIFQNCWKTINIAEKAITFRDKVPTKECEDAALAAYKEAGLDESSITKDKSFE